YATGRAELQWPRMRGAPTRADLADRFRVRRKRALHVSDSVALGSACATRRKREDEDARRSREEKITCLPGRLIQVFIPLRAKRRRRRPKRSPTSLPSIPTENPLTASPSSTSIRNRRRTPRSSATWRRPRSATSSTISVCSSCLCPNAPHPHVERRYLVVPGLRSSRIYILDTKPDPRAPKIVKVSEPAELADKTGYTRPHTVHCGPGGIYVAALGNKDGKAPGGVFVMDHESFEPLGRWEVDRGPQQLG